MTNVTVRTLKKTYWAKIIAQCTKDRIEKGGTITQWCIEHGISEKSYWYYHKKIGDQLAEELFEQQESPGTEAIPSVSFLPLEPPSQSPAVMHENKAVPRCGSLTVELSENITDTFLERLIRVMAHV